jgi:VanZ family protein
MTLIWKPAFWICAAAVLILSLAPASPELPTTGWDKTNHCLGFFALAILGLSAYPRRIMVVMSGLLVYGGLIEVLQSFTTYRFAEWLDWMADGVGVVFGYGFDLIRRRVTASRSV